MIASKIPGIFTQRQPRTPRRRFGNLCVDEFVLKRDLGEFDQFTGATVTPRGRQGGPQELTFFYRHRSQIFSANRLLNDTQAAPNE